MRAPERFSGATSDPSVSTDECLQMIQESLLQIEAASRKSTARQLKEVIPEMLRELEAQACNQGLVGMSTGLHSLDTATGGIRLGEVWTVGALPGRGKTAFGVQVALSNAKAGTPVAAFSLECKTPRSPSDSCVHILIRGNAGQKPADHSERSLDGVDGVSGKPV